MKSIFAVFFIKPKNKANNLNVQYEDVIKQSNHQMKCCIIIIISDHKICVSV